MTTYAGHVDTYTVNNADVAGRISSNLADFTAPLALATTNVDRSALTLGPASPYRNSPTIITYFLSVAQPGFGSDRLGPAADWFERFFVIFDGAAFGKLAIRDLGYLLSNQQMKFELWNTDRFAVRTVTALTPAGPTGVTWVDPYGLPLDYNALQSRLYDVQVRLAGAPQILNFLQVSFGALIGPDPTVQGLRVIPIPFLPNWADGFEEGPVYRTDIMVSDDDSEQRTRRRYQARHRIRYSVIPEDDRELQLLDELLYGWSRYAFGVPLWPDARRLAAPAGIGDKTIMLDTTQRRFIANGNILLISDAFTWEAAHVDLVDPAFLQLQDELQQNWATASTWVIPLYFGRLPAELLPERPTGALATFTVDALCDPPGL